MPKETGEALAMERILDIRPFYARRDYNCCGCGEVIAKGELNVAWSTTYYRGPIYSQGVHYCLPCWTLYVCIGFARERRHDAARLLKQFNKVIADASRR